MYQIELDEQPKLDLIEEATVSKFAQSTPAYLTRLREKSNDNQINVDHNTTKRKTGLVNTY